MALNHDEEDHQLQKPIIIAMKGHPGSGKSTVAYSIAKALKCPLIDKDHFRDCTKVLEETSSSSLLNDLSYQVIWKLASAQLSLGLGVVIDSPLSRPAYLDKLVEIAGDHNARLVIVECKPGDEAEWRSRIEKRAEGASWHKPRTWHDMEKLLEGYGGCWDYDVGDVPKMVVDTTTNVSIQEMVYSVLEFVKALEIQYKEKSTNDQCVKC